jgi:hypothetical protein
MLRLGRELWENDTTPLFLDREHMKGRMCF